MRPPPWGLDHTVKAASASSTTARAVARSSSSVRSCTGWATKTRRISGWPSLLRLLVGRLHERVGGDEHRRRVQRPPAPARRADRTTRRSLSRRAPRSPRRSAAAISRRRSAGRGLGEGRLGRALHLVAALAQQPLELVEEDVAARLADVEQGDAGAGAGGQRVGQRAAGRPRRARPSGRGSPGRRSSPRLHRSRVTGRRADLAGGPDAVDHREQAGVAAGVREQDAVGRRRTSPPACRGR